MMRKVTPEIIEDFKKDVINKMTTDDLAQKYNVSRGTVQNWRRDYVRLGKACLPYEELRDIATQKQKETFSARREVSKKQKKVKKDKPKADKPKVGEVNCDVAYKTCKYGHCGTYKCDYCGKTDGLIRGGSPHHCTKYEQGTPSREGGYE